MLFVTDQVDSVIIDIICRCVNNNVYLIPEDIEWR